jgi:hypothetical protein
LPGAIDDVIDLSGDEAVLSAILRHRSGELVECPIVPPMCDKAKLAVARDRRIVLIGEAGHGLTDLRSIGRAYQWLVENRNLIAMAVPTVPIDAKLMPQLSLLVDRADASARVAPADAAERSRDDRDLPQTQVGRQDRPAARSGVKRPSVATISVVTRAAESKPKIPAEWLAEFEAAARRPLEQRLRYAFVKTYKLSWTTRDFDRSTRWNSIGDGVRRTCRIGWLWPRLSTGRPQEIRDVFCASRCALSVHREVGRDPFLASPIRRKTPTCFVEKSADNGPRVVGALRELGFELTDSEAAEVARGKDFVQLKNGLSIWI